METDPELKDFFHKCHAAQSLRGLWRFAVDFFKSRGIAMVSYHRNDGIGERAGGIIATGFPDDWVCHYIGDGLIKVDPIPELSKRLARPFYWSETQNLMDLKPDQAEYLEDLRQAELGDGLAIQVFGPNMRNAYVGLGFGSNKPNLTSDQVFELQCAAQMAHIRYCELAADRLALKTDLTPREREILTWIAKGKSNSVIADILGISRHTVDTLTRRMFEKLKVHDRTSAALLGVGSGLVQSPVMME